MAIGNYFFCLLMTCDFNGFQKYYGPLRRAVNVALINCTRRIYPYIPRRCSRSRSEGKSSTTSKQRIQKQLGAFKNFMGY